MLFYAKYLDSSSKKSSADIMIYSVDNNMGYSALIYNNESDSLSLYCVLEQGPDYHKIHTMLTVATFLLALLFSIGTPTILVGVYGRLHKKMADNDWDLRYIVWAVAIVAFVLTLAMIGVNIYFVYKYLHQMHSNSTYGSYGLPATIILTPIAVILGLRYIHNSTETLKLSDFPIPHAFLICICDQSEKACRKSCGKGARYLLIFMACYFFTLFLVFFSFHGVYMVLGVVASPVVALSHITFYITAFLCLVVFTALFLKFSDKSECDRLCDPEQQNANQPNPEQQNANQPNPEQQNANQPNPGQQNANQPNPQNGSCCKVSFLIYVPPVLSAFLLFACVFAFGVFQYYFSTMVNYQHSGDFLSMLGSFLPSALLAFATFCGKKLMNCLKEKETVADPALQRALEQALLSITGGAGTNGNAGGAGTDAGNTGGASVGNKDRKRKGSNSETTSLIDESQPKPKYS